MLYGHVVGFDHYIVDVRAAHTPWNLVGTLYYRNLLRKRVA